VTDKTPKLTPKQEKFCQEYAIDLNATQAAIRAGYSAKTAGRIGGENVQKPEIHARLAELRADQSIRTQITADEILQQYADIARFRIEDLMTFDGKNAKYKPMTDWSKSAKVAVNSVKQKTTTRTDKDGAVTEYSEIEFKTDDRQKALDSLGKHLGLFTDFNMAIAALKTYGIELKQNTDGTYSIANGSIATTN
jgi:phage terminase small subunit